jgi:hypothetical protein
VNNMPKIIAESDVENVLAILDSLGYKILRGDNEASLPEGGYCQELHNFRKR